MTLRSILLETDLKDLKRILKSQKAYIFFDVSIFNVGVCIRVKCTDIYKHINYGNWNGYDQIHENDDVLKHFVSEVIKEREILNK